MIKIKYWYKFIKPIMGLSFAELGKTATKLN